MEKRKIHRNRRAFFADMDTRTPGETCPYCGLRFSSWFWWPGKGLYCWPCYKFLGATVVRKDLP